jgi:hypothetical protein
VRALLAAVLLRVDGFDAFDGEAKPLSPDGELGEAEQGIGAGERDAIVFAKARSAPLSSGRRTGRPPGGTKLATKMRQLAPIA